MPATKGANVLTMGMNRAIMMVLPPYFSKSGWFNEVRGVENERFLVIKHPRTYLVANCVVEGVAQDGGREKHQKENVRVKG